MGLLNSALHIGRTALLGYQGALQVVGNNISSAGTEDYTRLSPELSPLQGDTLAGNLKPGAGVALSGIQRNIDEALEGRVRLAIGQAEATRTQRDAMTRIEAVFAEDGGNGMATKITNLFNNFEELQNRPDDIATRELALASGAQLASSLHNTRSALIDIAKDVDSQVAGLVVAADRLATRIGQLNEEITTAEAGVQGQATGLRDQRDLLLRQLSEIFDVTVREQENGALNVYVGSEALVQGNFVRGLVASSESDGSITRTTARFADSNQQIDVNGGQLAGLIESRDVHALGRIAAVDQLAAGMIAGINRIHADGQGARGYQAVIGTVDLLATDAPLNADATGLSAQVQDGSFYITVLDDLTQTPVAHRIDVQAGGAADTTLESLVADIDAQVDGVTASITSDNRISLTADTGLSFVFGYDGQRGRTDTSGVLAALGVNTFFTGQDARDIAVAEPLLANPELIAASSVNIAGEGSNAGRLAGLDIVANDQLLGSTIPDFYSSIANNVAVSAKAVNEGDDASAAVLNSLEVQKQSISGVNLDEEAISLLKYERAFQGATRYLTSVQGMLDELILLIR